MCLSPLVVSGVAWPGFAHRSVGRDATSSSESSSEPRNLAWRIGIIYLVNAAMLIWTGDMGTRFASHVCVQAKEVGGAAMRSPFKLHTHNMCCGKCYADEPLELGDCYCHLVDDAGWCWCRYVQVLRHGPTTVSRKALCVLLPLNFCD